MGSTNLPPSVNIYDYVKSGPCVPILLRNDYENAKADQRVQTTLVMDTRAADFFRQTQALPGNPFATRGDFEPMPNQSPGLPLPPAIAQLIPEPLLNLAVQIRNLQPAQLLGNGLVNFGQMLGPQAERIMSNVAAFFFGMRKTRNDKDEDETAQTDQFFKLATQQEEAGMLQEAQHSQLGGGTK